MRSVASVAWFLLAATLFVGAQLRVPPVPVPALDSVRLLPISPTLRGGVLARRFPGRDFSLGLVVACEAGRRRISVQLGPLPADGRPVQLAVRTPAGFVERFGPLFEARRQRAFHFVVVDPADVGRFAAAALLSGSLVSNGYYSFRIELPEDHLAYLQRVLAECGQVPAGDPHRDGGRQSSTIRESSGVHPRASTPSSS